MKNYHLYLITNKVNGKKYVGITTEGFESRWNSHKRDCFRDTHRCYNIVLYNAMRKYGADNFEIELLAEKDSWKELCDAEKDTIILYNTHFKEGHGYNMTWGGDGIYGYKWTEEQLKKRPKKRSKEAIEKLKRNPNNRLSKFGGRNPVAREVLIEGIKYPSITEAAKHYNMKSGTVRARILNDKFMEWIYADGKGPNSALSNKHSSRMKPIVVDGIRYKSFVDAARVLGLTKDVIRKRVYNKKYKNYSLINVDS